MSTPIYDNLLERAKRHFTATIDQPLPEGRFDTRDSYFASEAAQSVVDPLSDRDALDVIAELYPRIARNPDYSVDGGDSFAETCRSTIRFCLYQDVLPPEETG